MKTNNSKLLTTLAGIAGFTSLSLFITLSSEAKEVLNPNPSIFNEATYNKGQRLQVNAQYTPTQAASEIEKGTTKGKQVAQKGSVTNPRPSIFSEPPYNRSGSTTPSEPTPPTPRTTPETQPGKTPTLTPPRPGASNNQGKNLLTLAESNASFKTLTRALKAAG